MADKDRNKRIWDNYAGFYDFEIKLFSGKAYSIMYQMMAEVLNDRMDVLEVATGTGLIAGNIAKYVNSITATDYSEKMLARAKKKKMPANVSFSLENVMDLSFKDNSFDVVIISNALHVMPDPIKALENIRRVLKPQGLLIAPNYSHGHISDATWDLNTRMLKMIGLDSYAKWKPEEYIDFINQNGFKVTKWQVLKAAFPLVYLEAYKNK